jgi:hypothetical protein
MGLMQSRISYSEDQLSLIALVQVPTKGAIIVPRRKITIRDWLKGAGQSVRDGTAMNPFETQRRVNQAHDSRQNTYPIATGGDWYTKYRKKDGTIHIMLDRNGRLTTTYPHVHVIHDEPAAEIRIVLSRGPNDHERAATLPGGSSGNEVNAAVESAFRRL